MQFVGTCSSWGKIPCQWWWLYEKLEFVGWNVALTKYHYAPCICCCFCGNWLEALLSEQTSYFNVYLFFLYLLLVAIFTCLPSLSTCWYPFICFLFPPFRLTLFHSLSLSLSLSFSLSHTHIYIYNSIIPVVYDGIIFACLWIQMY